MNQLTQLQPTKKKRVPLIKPQSSGMIEKALVVGGGVAVIYTFSATLPIASLAAVIAIGSYFLDEIRKFQPREVSEELTAILNAKTPKHPSINEIKSALKAQYPVEAINAAIESMIGDTGLVQFKSTDNHPLACFGSVYCWINPEDPNDVKLPLQRIEELFQQWGIIATVEAQATTETVTAPSIPATPSAVDTSSLIERLKAECHELLHLVKAPPIRLVGLQRTGKSSFARKLALLRMILLPGHSVLWATPHLELDNPLPATLNPIGYTPEGKKDFAAIEATWSEMQAQIDQGKHPNKTAVWDEFGSYDAFENLELLGSSLRSLLRESSKHEYYPIIIAHGDQAAFYPGVANILTTLKQSTVKVETIGTAANDFGEMKPTGEVKIHGLDGQVKQFKLPDWLTEEYLLNLLSGKVEQPTTVVEPVEPISQGEPEEGEPHEVVEAEARSPEETLKQRIGKKLTEKLISSKGEWVSMNALIRDTFSQPQDRETAKHLLIFGIEKKRLECQERENPNKTKTILVRVSTNSNSTPTV